MRAIVRTAQTARARQKVPVRVAPAPTGSMPKVAFVKLVLRVSSARLVASWLALVVATTKTREHLMQAHACHARMASMELKMARARPIFVRLVLRANLATSLGLKQNQPVSFVQRVSSRRKLLQEAKVIASSVVQVRTKQMKIRNKKSVF